MKLALRLILPLLLVSTFTQAKLKVGEQAKDFVADTMAGESIQLAQYKGKRVNLVFLDSLCPMPHFPNCEAKIAKLNNRVDDEKQVAWVGVVSSFYVDKAAVQAFKQKFDIQIPLIFDEGNKIFQTYQVFASPYLISIDKAQAITYRGDKF